MTTQKPSQKKIIKSQDMIQQASLEEKLANPAAPAMPREQMAQEMGAVVHKRVLDAQSQAAEIIQAAHADAETIREQAQGLLAEVDGIREAAKESGFAAGREEGAAAFTEEAVAFRAQQEEFYAKAEPEIVQLVMQIAEKVIGDLTSDHQDVVVAVVRQAVSASLGNKVEVRVHPEDYDTVVVAQEDLRANLERSKTLHFTKDQDVRRGGCVVETEIGTIDANLDGQLAAIRKALQL